MAGYKRVESIANELDWLFWKVSSVMLAKGWTDGMSFLTYFCIRYRKPFDNEVARICRGNAELIEAAHKAFVEMFLRMDWKKYHDEIDSKIRDEIETYGSIDDKRWLLCSDEMLLDLGRDS